METTGLHKANFDLIYNQNTPRAYFNTLGRYDYRIPESGAEILAQLLSESGNGKPITVLDLCCSYGTIGAMLKTDLNLANLYQHYGEDDVNNLDTSELLKIDKAYFTKHKIDAPPKVYGLDVAENAVQYAEKTGILNKGFLEDLEKKNPSKELSQALSEVDLIVSTGGIGYITERTFKRILDATKPSIRVASFCLRAYNFDPIRRKLEEYGLQTEKASTNFLQRKFIDKEEQEWNISQVQRWGLDTRGFENDGYYHASFYLSRPETDVKRVPASMILPDFFD